MRIDATITVTTDDTLELERISKGLAGAKVTRDDSIARILYGGTTPERSEAGDDTGLGMHAEHQAALAARDQALRDRDFYKTQAEKNAARALRAERKLRARRKR